MASFKHGSSEFGFSWRGIAVVCWLLDLNCRSLLFDRFVLFCVALLTFTNPETHNTPYTDSPNPSEGKSQIQPIPTKTNREPALRHTTNLQLAQAAQSNLQLAQAAQSGLAQKQITTKYMISRNGFHSAPCPHSKPKQAGVFQETSPTNFPISCSQSIPPRPAPRFCFVIMTVWAMLLVEIVHPLVMELNDATDVFQETHETHCYQLSVGRTVSFWQDCPQCLRATSSVMHANLLLFKTVIAGDSWGRIAVPVSA